MVALDAAILMHPQTWEASGHLAGFTDPLVQCLGKCKKRWRADHLARTAAEDAEGELKCPECGGELGEARQFNLMFETYMGPVADDAARDLPAARDRPGHLRQLQERPAVLAQEAAVRHRADRQVVPQRDHAGQLHLPHARVRADGDRVLRAARRGGRVARALDGRAHALVHGPRHPARPPAAARARRRTSCRTTRAATTDIEYLFPMGWSELEGIANRSDFDLTQHAKFSRREARVLRPGHRRALRPARDRAVRRRRPRRRSPSWSTPTTRRRSRAASARVLRLHPRLAPVKVAVLPLVNKDGQPEKARAIYEELRKRMPAEFDAGGSIGKRYRRQDEIGTPVGRHDRPPDDGGRHGHAARPRLARPVADRDRRARRRARRAAWASPGTRRSWARRPERWNASSVGGTCQRSSSSCLSSSSP